MRASAVPGLRIAPSILSADFAGLGDQMDHVIASGADLVHMAFMDTHSVPSLTASPFERRALCPRLMPVLGLHKLVRERATAGTRRRTA